MTVFSKGSSLAKWTVYLLLWVCFYITSHSFIYTYMCRLLFSEIQVHVLHRHAVLKYKNTNRKRLMCTAEMRNTRSNQFRAKALRALRHGVREKRGEQRFSL